MSQASSRQDLPKALSAFLIVALLSALDMQTAFAAPLAVASSSFASTRTITVQALIDGKTQLILHGNTAQWFNIDFAAPGRWAGRNDPTLINDKEWFPVWPDVPDTDNYSCNCSSSIFRGVTPLLPRSDMTVDLKVIQGRGDVHIAQAPTDANNHTLIVEFDDDPLDGAAIYEIELDVNALSQILRTVTVQAVIDGRSQLILRGNTAQWLHFDFAAPGRLEFSNDPTLINGRQWFPIWPDVPDAENRDCSCTSSIFKGVTPALPQTDMVAEVRVIQGRGLVSIVQLPSAANDHTLILEFDDNPFGGSDTYQVELNIRFAR